MISQKATISIVQFILVIGICVILGLLFISNLILPAWGEGCKQTQMNELNKIWKELRYWETKNKTIPPGSYNIVPDVKTNPCIKEIKYDGSTQNLIIEWTDGAEEEIPTNAVWSMKNPNPPPEYIDLRLTSDSCPEPEFCDFRVSLGSVELL